MTGSPTIDRIAFWSSFGKPRNSVAGAVVRMTLSPGQKSCMYLSQIHSVQRHLTCFMPSFLVASRSPCLAAIAQSPAVAIAKATREFSASGSLACYRLHPPDSCKYILGAVLPVCNRSSRANKGADKSVAHGAQNS
jgi:hypothetical protein